MLVHHIIKEGHNVVCVSTNLSWFGTCVGPCSCTSSNSLQKNQCNTNETLSAPPPVCLRQVHSLHAHKRCRIDPLIVANHRLHSRRHFFWGGGGGGRGRKKKCRGRTIRRGVLPSHSRVPLARPRMLRRLSQTAPAS